MKKEQSGTAKVVVTKRIYPGIKVTVNGVATQILDMHTNICIKRRGEDIGLFANE